MVRDETQSVDVITGLKQKTHFGRPEWTNIFKHIANDNPRLDCLFVCLFVCLPEFSISGLIFSGSVGVVFSGSVPRYSQARYFQARYFQA